jgi:hypothetical protein
MSSLFRKNVGKIVDSASVHLNADFLRECLRTFCNVLQVIQYQGVIAMDAFRDSNWGGNIQ